MPEFRNFHLRVIDERETAVDTEARKVVLHLTSSADMDVGVYENEYYFVLRMSESGELVEDVVEWMDSKYTAEFVERLNGEKKGG